MKNISYIIPHYKSTISLERLISSIEIIGEDEIIVIDDCSGEYEYNKLEKLKERYQFKLLSTPSNLGAGAARNIGLAQAKNDWILFADSDDYFLPGYRGFIEDYTKSDADIVYFKPTSVKEGKNESVQGDRHSYYVYLIDKYNSLNNQESLNNLKYKMVVPWSKLISKRIIFEHNIKFDEVAVSNDVMFAMRLGRVANKVLTSDSIIYCCTENSNSLTSNISFDNFYTRLKIFSRQFKFLRDNLPEYYFEELNLTGVSFIYKTYKYKYTTKQKIDIIYFLLKNDIPLINKKWIKNRVRGGRT